MIMDDYIVDITNYFQKHPGGASILEENAGTDANLLFEKVCHTSEAYETMLEMKVAHVNTCKLVCMYVCMTIQHCICIKEKEKRMILIKTKSYQKIFYYNKIIFLITIRTPTSHSSVSFQPSPSQIAERSKTKK
jgi:Cytochrome b5-like Heme/Steroid binding domain